MLSKDKLSPATRVTAQRIATISAICVVAIGATALFGWVIGNDTLKTLAAGTASMKPNTAICLLLCAAALWCAAQERRTAWTRLIHIFAPLVVAAIALLTLLQFVFGVNFGIDEALFRDPATYAQAAPGRMAIPSIVAFLLFASAVRSNLWPHSPRARALFLFTTVTGLAIATLALIGYGYELPILYSPLPQNSIALNTAIAFFILFIGVSALRPDLGWFALLETSSISGIFARWLLPAIVFVPIFLGWLIFRISKAGLFSPQESIALFALGSIICMGAVAWGVGMVANRLGERLKTREQVLATVVETALDAFVMINERGQVMHWNPRAEEMFGWTYAEADNHPLADLIIPEALRGRHNEGLRRFIATGDGPVMRRRLELEALRKNGETFPVELMIYPAHVGGAWVFCAFVKDVSDLRHAEAQLRQAQKMEAVGQLTSGVAHDFNNLLTVIIASLDSILPRVSEELRPRIDNAMQAAERGAALTRQLLAYSRRQTLSPEHIDLNRVAENLQHLLERTLGTAVELQFRLSPAPCPAFADASQVESALLNLAINARDAMPSGGRLLIETAEVELDENYAALNADVTPGRYAMLAVSDTGEGMSNDVREHAFEPFFTTKEIGKGSGLGLSMIYGFAKQSHGHVKIYSELAHGTTVKLYLPYGQYTAAKSAVRATPKPEHRAQGETILVVEDDVNVRGAALMHLRELGYNTLEAANGPEALTLLNNGHSVDLLFTDVMMPGGMTGRQLAVIANALRPGLKTLYTSGYTDNSIVHEGRLDPGVNFLAKPYRLLDLAAKVRLAIESEAVI
jgi:PAS domain S-box-containing protein